MCDMRRETDTLKLSHKVTMQIKYAIDFCGRGFHHMYVTDKEGCGQDTVERDWLLDFRISNLTFSTSNH